MLNETSHHTIPFNKTDKEFESREYKIVKNKVIWSLLRNYFRKTPFYVFLFIYLLASFAFFVRFSCFLIFVLVHVTYVGREPQSMRDEEKNFLSIQFSQYSSFTHGTFWASLASS